MLTEDQIRALIAANNIKAFYKDYDWRMLALDVIREHHGECQMCRKAKRLTRATLAHHILYLRDRPDLAYERSNLMPLCHDCHERIHGRGQYAAGRPRFTNEERW